MMDRTNTRERMHEALVHHPALTSLDLSHNLTTREDAEMLIQTLECNPRLVDLIVDRDMGAEYTAIMEMCASNSAKAAKKKGKKKKKVSGLKGGVTGGSSEPLDPKCMSSRGWSAML